MEIYQREQDRRQKSREEQGRRNEQARRFTERQRLAREQQERMKQDALEQERRERVNARPEEKFRSRTERPEGIHNSPAQDRFRNQPAVQEQSARSRPMSDPAPRSAGMADQEYAQWVRRVIVAKTRGA